MTRNHVMIGGLAVVAGAFWVTHTADAGIQENPFEVRAEELDTTLYTADELGLTSDELKQWEELSTEEKRALLDDPNIWGAVAKEVAKAVSYDVAKEAVTRGFQAGREATRAYNREVGRARAEARGHTGPALKHDPDNPSDPHLFDVQRF